MIIIWNASKLAMRKRNLENAQNYVDKTIFENMKPYIPVALDKYKNHGRLSDSGKIAQKGKIVYTSPFARKDYYAVVNHKNGGNKKAQRMWFEFVKSRYGKVILRGAAEIVGGKPK